MASVNEQGCVGRLRLNWGGVFSFFFILFCSLVMISCQAGSEKIAQSNRVFDSPPGQSETLVNVFLQLTNESVAGVWFRLGAVEMVAENGTVPLVLGRKEFCGSEIRGQQRLLAQGNIKSGSYSSLRLFFEKAALQKDGQQYIMSVPEPVIDLPLPANFKLKPQDSFSLFVYWDEEGSIRSKALFHPRMHISPQQKPLFADLAYVSCPDIDTVFVVRTDKNWVVGSLAIPGQPTYMDYDADNKKLYILSKAKSAVNVVEVPAGNLYDKINVPFAEKLTHMIIPDGQTGYFIDEVGNYLIKMDLISGSQEGRERLGFQPLYLHWLEESQRIVLSAGDSQQVYFIDPTGLTEIGSIRVGGIPQGLIKDESSLLVVEYESNSLGVYNLLTGQLEKKIKVGFGPRRVFKSGDQIYVSNYDGNTVSVLWSPQLRFLRDVLVGQGPFEMASSTDNKWLYVIEHFTGKMAVIDQTVNRVVSHIEFGASPFDMVTVQ
jgi:DNA-binding beta-propeller fold protein YncE